MIRRWTALGVVTAEKKFRRIKGYRHMGALVPFEANRNLLTAMSLLPKSIHWCRRYPTKFNSGRDIPVLFSHPLLRLGSESKSPPGPSRTT